VSFITNTLIEKRTHPGTPAQWLIDYFGGRESKSGVAVTEESALYSTAVYSCIRLLSSTLASLPLILYKRLEKGKDRATAHPTYNLAHKKANPEMPAYIFRETLMAHILIYGNAYAQIIRDQTGYPVQLWPLRPDRTTIDRVNGKLVYEYENDMKTKIFKAEEILHIPGLGFDGIQGYSSIKLLNEAIGLSLATEQFGSMFFGEGTHPSGVITLPADRSLGKDPNPTFLKSLKDGFAGLGKSHKLMLLEDGMKLEMVGVDPEKAQALETRRFQLNEIARFYGVQPHMVGELTKSSFNNIEEQGLEFVVYTLRPWLIRWEQYHDMQLLSEKEQNKYFYEFLIDGLLRGNMEARSGFYQKGVNNGWYSVNDVLEMENRNPVDGGDKRFIPMNLIPLDKAGDDIQIKTKENIGDNKNEEKNIKFKEVRAERAILGRQRLKRAYKKLFLDAARRIVRRERNDIEREAKKLLQRSETDFDKYLDNYYENFGGFIEKNMLPVLMSYAEAVTGEVANEVGIESNMTPELEKFIRGYMGVYSAEHIITSRGKLKTIVRESIDAGENAINNINERLQEWEETRPERIANWQTSEAEGAVTKYTYILAGIRKIRWNTVGKNCPYCNELSGQVIGIDKTFVRKTGLEIEGELIFKPSTNITHPPLHTGCNCYLSMG